VILVGHKKFALCGEMIVDDDDEIMMRRCNYNSRLYEEEYESK
jgi:hypothetical protein